MNSNRSVSLWMFAAIALLAASPSCASAFDVSIDTAPLSGTQTLAVSLTQGDGLFLNTVTLSDFNFGGGGAPLGTPSYSDASVSGDLGSTVSLADVNFSEFFSQTFQAGSSLSFLLNTTDNFVSGFPDELDIYLCDATLSTCYSDDLDTSALLTLDLTGAPLTPTSFTLNAASQQGLNAPVVTFAAPEPGTLVPLLLVGLALAVSRFRSDCRQ